jgi:hypothetical protein
LGWSDCGENSQSEHQFLHAPIFTDGTLGFKGERLRWPESLRQHCSRRSLSAQSGEHSEAYSLQNAFTSSFKLFDAVYVPDNFRDSPATACPHVKFLRTVEGVAVAISADFRYLVLDEQTLDMKSGKPIVVGRHKQDTLDAAAFSANGELMAVKASPNIARGAQLGWWDQGQITITPSSCR